MKLNLMSLINNQTNHEAESLDVNFKIKNFNTSDTEKQAELIDNK